jgi:hypothetical protein
VVIGNCGFGFAPVAPELRERSMLSMTKVEAIPLASMQAGMPWDWTTYPEFLDSVERAPKAVNVLPYVARRAAADLGDGLRGRQGRAHADRGRARRDGAVCCTRRWMPAPAAGRRSACCPRARPPCSATSTARRCPPM